MLVLALAFATLFTPKTMRVDYFHTGDRGREIVALDRVVSDGPWAGSTTRLIDDLNLGSYLFEVIDPASRRAIYTRGFASLYGEWEETAEAKETARTFHESLRFPWPKAKVEVVLKKRGADGAFKPIWTTTIDPDSPTVNPSDAAPQGKGLDGVRARRSDGEGRSPDLGRGLHRSRASEIPRRREAPDRQAVRDRAVP